MLTANLPWTNSASSSLWSAKKSNWSHSVDSKGNGAASLTTSLAMLNCCEVSSYSKEVCWYYCVREQCCARHMESSVLRKLSRLSSNSSPNKQECTNTGLKSKLMIKGSKRSDPWSTKKKGQGFDHKGSLGTSPRNPHDGVYVTVSLLFCFNQNNMEVKPILRKISQNANNKFWWCSRFWRDFDLLGYVSLLHINKVYPIYTTYIRYCVTICGDITSSVEVWGLCVLFFSCYRHPTCIVLLVSMNWAWHAEEYTTENCCIANINMAYSEWFLPVDATLLTL